MEHDWKEFDWANNGFSYFVCKTCSLIKAIPKNGNVSWSRGISYLEYDGYNLDNADSISCNQRLLEDIMK